MARRTLPPHLAMAARRDHFRCQRTVERWVPLCGDLRRNRRKVVETREHLSARTVGTADFPRSPQGDDRLIAVTQRTTPPRLPVAGGCHRLRRKCSVFLHVPFLCQRGVEGSQIVEAFCNDFSSADRTACLLVYTRSNRTLPGMSFFTSPPNLAPRTAGHLLRRQGSIFLRVPLRNQLRGNVCQ